MWFSLPLQIVVFLTLNSTLNLFNRWLLGIAGFPFPILITICHMAFSCVTLAPLAMFGKPAAKQQPSGKGHEVDTQNVPEQRKPYLLIALAGMSQAANIATNNISLVTITLTLNQIIRASLPVVTALVALVVNRGESALAQTRPSGREMVALTILCIGTMLAVWQGTVAGEAFGVTCCVLSTFLNATMMVLCGKVMALYQTTSMMMTLYMAPVSLLTLLPMFFASEYRPLLAYASTMAPGAPATIVQLVLLSCVNAVLYNVVHFMVIAATCAVTSTVLGMAKMIVLLLLSNTLLGEYHSLTPSMTAGMILAMLGFCWYGALKTKLMATIRSSKTLTTSLSLTVPLLRKTSSAESAKLKQRTSAA